MRPAATALLSLVVFLAAAPAQAQYGQPASAGMNLAGPAGEYLSVTNKADIQGNPAYTLEAWVYPLSYNNFPTIIGNDYHTSFWLGLNTAGNVRFYPTGGTSVETAAVVPLNTWTHVAANYVQGVGWSIFINGLLVSTGFGIVGAVGTTADDLRIGADREFGSPDYLWQGYLDEVRIWSGARNATEIQSTMYVEVGTPYFHTPAYSDLEAAWDMHLPLVTGAFDRCRGFGKADNLALFKPGPVLSNAFNSPVSPNVGIELNGIDDYAVIPMGDGFASGLSVEAWVAPRSYAGFPTIAGRNFINSFWLGLSTSGKLRFYPTGGTFIESNLTIPLDRWTHVAATYRAGITTLYVNGRLDRQSGAITGPVGESGLEVHVGADNPPSFYWDGWLDQVRITRGELEPLAVRRGMFTGYSGFINPFNVNTSGGGIEEQWRADFDGFPGIEVFGSSARLAKSGAALSAPGWAPPTAPAYAFVYDSFGGFTLPNGDGSTSVGDDLPSLVNGVVNDVDVFVFAPTTDLSQCRVTLRSPSLTTIDLVTLGAARGRDLHTVFNDGAVNTLATGVIPYTAGVRPSMPLSTFNGEPAAGNWRLVISAAPGPTRLDLWSWGIRVNGATIDVPGADGPLAADLRMAGAHPVRGMGTLAFDLPRAANVDLALVDVQGRRVRPLFEGAQEAGTVSLQWRTGDLAPGVYFAVLRLDGTVEKQLRVVVIE